MTGIGSIQQGAVGMVFEIETGTTAYFTLDIAIAFGAHLSGITDDNERLRQKEEFMERSQWIYSRSEGDIWDWLERWQDEAAGGEPDWSDWLFAYCNSLRAQWVGL